MKYQDQGDSARYRGVGPGKLTVPFSEGQDNGLLRLLGEPGLQQRDAGPRVPRDAGVGGGGSRVWL